MNEARRKRLRRDLDQIEETARSVYEEWEAEPDHTMAHHHILDAVDHLESAVDELGLAIAVGLFGKEAS